LSEVDASEFLDSNVLTSGMEILLSQAFARLAGTGSSSGIYKLSESMGGGKTLSPLGGRELALLLWALQEDGAPVQLEAILHGWRELAREERWWLYAKAAAHGQHRGAGWRRALFHALSKSTESRAAPPPAEKKARLQRKPAALPELRCAA